MRIYATRWRTIAERDAFLLGCATADPEAMCVFARTRKDREGFFTAFLVRQDEDVHVKTIGHARVIELWRDGEPTEPNTPIETGPMATAG